MGIVSFSLCVGIGVWATLLFVERVSLRQAVVAYRWGANLAILRAEHVCKT